MSYSISVQCSKYLPGASSATIKVYNVSDGSEVTLTSSACTETGTDLFYWSSSNIATQPTTRTEYYYIMTPNTGEAKHGKFSLLTYSDHIHLERMLRAVGRGIKVGPVSPIKQSGDAYDIEQDELTEFLRDADAYIDGQLSRIYSLPLALTSPLTKRLMQSLGSWLGGYYAYEALYPHGAAGELPEAVKGWKERADKLLADIASHEVLLLDETPATGSPLLSVPKYGMPGTIYDSYGCETVDTVEDDDDITAGP